MYIFKYCTYIYVYVYIIHIVYNIILGHFFFKLNTYFFEKYLFSEKCCSFNLKLLHINIILQLFYC